MPRSRMTFIKPGSRLPRLHLSPLALSRLFLKLVESKVIWKGVRTPCWEWIGYRDENGYGQCSIKGKTLWVHRAFYAIFKGPIPAEDQIDHRCHNPSCCNPQHLLRKHPLKHATESARYGARCRTSTPTGPTPTKQTKESPSQCRTYGEKRSTSHDDGKDIPF